MLDLEVSAGYKPETFQVKTSTLHVFFNGIWDLELKSSHFWEQMESIIIWRRMNKQRLQETSLIFAGESKNLRDYKIFFFVFIEIIIHGYALLSNVSLCL